MDFSHPTYYNNGTYSKSPKFLGGEIASRLKHVRHGYSVYCSLIVLMKMYTDKVYFGVDTKGGFTLWVDNCCAIMFRPRFLDTLRGMLRYTRKTRVKKVQVYFYDNEFTLAEGEYRATIGLNPRFYFGINAVEETTNIVGMIQKCYMYTIGINSFELISGAAFSMRFYGSASWHNPVAWFTPDTYTYDLDHLSNVFRRLPRNSPISDTIDGFLGKGWVVGLQTQATLVTRSSRF